MKKYYFVAMLVIFSLTVSAQDRYKDMQYFKVNPDPEHYIGKNFKIIPLDTALRKFGYHHFIKDVTKDKYSSDNIAFSTGFMTSDAGTLENQIFKCIGVAETTDLDNCLKLENNKLGTIYYIYGTSSSFNEVVCIEDEIKIKEEEKIKETTEKAEIAQKASRAKAVKANPCLLLDTTADDFNHSKTISTPLDNGKHEDSDYISGRNKMMNCSISRVIKRGISTYYLYLTTEGFTPLATEQGVIIILNNGKRITKPNESVKTDVDNNAKFIRSSSIRLTAADIAILKTAPISKFKLYIDQDTVTDADLLYKTFLCLSAK